MKEKKTINQVKEPYKSWGGPWTEKKLRAFSKYVWSYLTIMKQFPYWETIYFDGFAGSGTKKLIKNTTLFDQLEITQEDVDVYKGAAERVLSLRDELRFDYYYFVDTAEEYLLSLEAKLRELPGAENKKLVFRHGDANDQLDDLSFASNNPTAVKIASQIIKTA